MSSSRLIDLDGLRRANRGEVQPRLVALEIDSALACGSRSVRRTLRVRRSNFESTRLGSSVAASDPVQDHRRVVFRAVLPDEVVAVQQHVVTFSGRSTYACFLAVLAAPQSEPGLTRSG
jgi:hypothetical protein